MTYTELLAKIKAEAERLIDEYKPIVGGVDELTGAHIVLAKLLSFLSTLESENPMQEGLEEELDRFIASGKSVTVEDCGTYKVSYHDFKKVARHFAQWGAERFAKIVRKNLPEISNNAQSQFEQLYFEITGAKMYGGYND